MLARVLGWVKLVAGESSFVRSTLAIQLLGLTRSLASI